MTTCWMMTSLIRWRRLLSAWRWTAWRPMLLKPKQNSRPRARTSRRAWHAKCGSILGKCSALYSSCCSVLPFFLSLGAPLVVELNPALILVLSVRCQFCTGKPMVFGQNQHAPFFVFFSQNGACCFCPKTIGFPVQN